MGGGPPDFLQGFSCPAVLWIPLAVFGFHIRGFHSLWLAFPKPFYYPTTHILWSITPWYCYHGLGSFPFARRYLGNRIFFHKKECFFFLFLRLLRCFSSPGSLYIPMYSVCSDQGFLGRVSPFRNPRVKGYLLLTVAYRSLSRLSSALSAKASTLRSCSLDLNSDCSDNIPPSVTVRRLVLVAYD